MNVAFNCTLPFVSPAIAVTAPGIVEASGAVKSLFVSDVVSETVMFPSSLNGQALAPLSPSL
ncbi:hypothetical protein D3C80_1943950 [compost metagenome]